MQITAYRLAKDIRVPATRIHAIIKVVGESRQIPPCDWKGILAFRKAISSACRHSLTSERPNGVRPTHCRGSGSLCGEPQGRGAVGSLLVPTVPSCISITIRITNWIWQRHCGGEIPGSPRMRCLRPWGSSRSRPSHSGVSVPRGGAWPARTSSLPWR